MKRTSNRKSGPRLCQSFESKLYSLWAILATSFNTPGEESGHKICKVQESEHLQDGLVSASVLGSIMLVEQKQAPLRMVPDYFLYQWRGEAFEVE